MLTSTGYRSESGSGRTWESSGRGKQRELLSVRAVNSEIWATDCVDDAWGLLLSRCLSVAVPIYKV